jgi:hypothetical protein
MPTLQVREVPMHVYGQLKELAAKEHRSLGQQTLVTIERGLNAVPDAVERRRALLDKVRRRTVGPKASDLPSPADVLREDRSR